MRCVWEECHLVLRVSWCLRFLLLWLPLGCCSALRPYCGEDCILLSSKRAAERAVGRHEENSVGCNTWKSNLYCLVLHQQRKLAASGRARLRKHATNAPIHPILAAMSQGSRYVVQ